MCCEEFVTTEGNGNQMQFILRALTKLHEFAYFMIAVIQMNELRKLLPKVDIISLVRHIAAVCRNIVAEKNFYKLRTMGAETKIYLCNKLI